MAQKSDAEILLNGSKMCEDKCRYTSFDIHEESKKAVFVADQGQRLRMYYKVGKYKEENRIEWSSSREYSRGRLPSVALIQNKDTLYAVEVHNSEIYRDLYYNIGIVTTEGTIEWMRDHDVRIGNGKKPKISSSGNKIILVYEDVDSFMSHKLNIQVGTLVLTSPGGEKPTREEFQCEEELPTKSTSDSEKPYSAAAVGGACNQPANTSSTTIRASATAGGEYADIKWGDKCRIPSITGVEPDVSAEGDKVAVVYRSPFIMGEIKVKIGSIGVNSTIAWNNPSATCDTGLNPSISINSSGNVVVFYQGLLRHLYHIGGYIKEGRVQWLNITKRRCPDGEYPTVMLTNNNMLILIHKANIAHSMYQSEGTFYVPK